jgi:hypothetical protein
MTVRLHSPIAAEAITVRSPPVRPAGDGNSKRRVEQPEGDARQKSQLGIRQVQTLLDRLQQQDDQSLVHAVQGIDQGQNSQDIPAPGRRFSVVWPTILSPRVGRHVISGSAAIPRWFPDIE